jgi:RNA polymerase sigma-70 factor (ECF subfamily)
MIEFQEGNKKSFEELIRRYFPRLLNFINRYIGDRQRAEDLTQEVFIRVYKSAAKYKAQSKFQTWIFTIAKNLSVNELRRNKFKMLSLEQTLSTPGGEIRLQWQDSNAVGPDHEALFNERAIAVKSAIDSLPENQRVAVLLRRYENFSYEEIAMTMNVSAKAVKSLLSRAKVNLSSKLEKWAKNR